MYPNDPNNPNNWPQDPQQPSQPPQQPVQQPQNLPPNWQPPQDTTVDYLNQIAPNSGRRGLSGKQLGLFGALAAMLLIAFFLMMSMGGGGRENISQQAQRAVSYNASMEQVADEAAQYIRSRELASLNTTLGVYFTNTKRELGQATGINYEEVPLILADTTLEAILPRLEDAHLAGTFDATYSNDLQLQLTHISALFEDILERTNDDTTREAIEKARDDLAPLREQLENIEIATF